MVAGGHVWLLGGFEGVCMVAGRACMVAGGHVWLLGVCVVARGCAWLLGGMHGCRGHAWLLGGMHGLWGGGVRRIRRDTVNERAVRILLECILVLLL